MELVIDVSASAIAAGVARSGEVVWSGSCLTTRDHTTMLLPQILAGISEVGARPEDISLVIVATGPGPFNGLRVALSLAKGIAVAMGIPVVGIDSLLAEASRCQAQEGYLRPIMRAGKTTLATALFQKSDTSWQAIEDAQVVTEQDTVEIVRRRPTPVCGDIDESLRALFEQSTAEFVEPQRTRIQSLAALGCERATAGKIDSVATLQPLYVRPPHITTPRERRH
jgi:tRNA threonylcarbamoyladenosine biosynthesis protein TsaB